MWHCKLYTVCFYILTFYLFFLFPGEAGGGGPTCTGKEPSTAAGLPTPAPWRKPRAAWGRAAHHHHSTHLTLLCPGEREEKGWPCQCGNRGPASCGDTARCPAERSCSAAPVRTRMGRPLHPKPSMDVHCHCTARQCNTPCLGVWNTWQTP